MGSSSRITRKHAHFAAECRLAHSENKDITQVPKEGEEIKAQYAFSNALSRKVVTCRLTTLTRSGRTGGDATTKKVMCRVGGGEFCSYVMYSL